MITNQPSISLYSRWFKYINAFVKFHRLIKWTYTLADGGITWKRSCEMRNYISAGIYLLKVNKRNTRTRSEICSELTIKTPHSGVSIVTFEQVNAGWVSKIFFWTVLKSIFFKNYSNKKIIKTIQGTQVIQEWMTILTLK